MAQSIVKIYRIISKCITDIKQANQRVYDGDRIDYKTDMLRREMEKKYVRIEDTFYMKTKDGAELTVKVKEQIKEDLIGVAASAVLLYQEIS